MARKSINFDSTRLLHLAIKSNNLPLAIQNKIIKGCPFN